MLAVLVTVLYSPRTTLVDVVAVIVVALMIVASLLGSLGRDIWRQREISGTEGGV